MSRYPHLSANFHRNARKKLAKGLKTNSVAIISSNKRFISNADAFYSFKQNSDFFYLTGIYTVNTKLVIAKNFKDEVTEYLFIPKITAEKAIWEGSELTREKASELTGIINVEWNKDRHGILRSIIYETTTLYLPLATNGPRIPSHSNLVAEIKQKFRNPTESLLPLIRKLRMIKGPEEINAIRKALEITSNGLRACKEYLQEGSWEFEIESTLLKSFLDQRSRGFAFEPIIAGGKNSCTLHYTENSNQLVGGEVLLLDIGAEFSGYNADITRVVPVSTFSNVQQKVFQAVDSVVENSVKFFKPGTTIREINSEVAALVQDELVKLGLISPKEKVSKPDGSAAYRKYYMHSASHFLGLDVHDVGLGDDILQEGMVLTLEPGIYVNEWETGVRLEEDILITKSGNEVLSAGIPRNWEAWK